MTTAGTGITSLADLRARCVVDDIGSCWRWARAFSVNTCRGSRCPVAHNPATGRVITATRLAIMLAGKTPGALTWRSCSSDACVNPQHLLTGSRAEWGRWCEREGILRGKPARRAANRRAKITSGAKLSPELAAWVLESRQRCADIAHALSVSPTTVSRVKLGRTWQPLASPFAGLGAIAMPRHRPGPGARARAANEARAKLAA